MGRKTGRTTKKRVQLRDSIEVFADFFVPNKNRVQLDGTE